MKKKLPRTKGSGVKAYQHNFAILNAREEKVWRCAFRDARTRLKYGEFRADDYAWKKVQRQFPRLRKYDGLWGFASNKSDKEVW